MNENKVGVGPYPKPWPTDDKYDPELLKHGDRRNVLDRYRYWTNEAIKADLNESRSQLQIAIENFQHDFNIGSIVRSANAFNVDTVHIIGKKQWNKRGAMVTNRYMNVIHHRTVDDFVSYVEKDKKHIVAVDIIPGAEPLSRVKLPKNTVLVFGGEGPGLSEEMRSVSEKTAMIEQFGSTRSVNVGVAAGIAMYVWLQQNVLSEEACN